MSFGGFVRRSAYWTVDFFRGRPMHRHYADIKRILSDAKMGRKLQKQHLDRLLEHSVKYSEFYKPYKGMAFSEFPVTNKLKNIENYKKIIVDRKNVPNQKKGNIHIQRTSGSTGVPFSIHQDTVKRQRRIAALKYFGAIAGYRSHESLVQCEIWGDAKKTNMKIFSENIYPIDVQKMDDKTMEHMCKIITDRNASALMMFGGWAESFSKYLTENPKRFKKLKIVFSGAEALRGSVREQLKKQLGCNVVERYANEEQGVLGQQRADGDCYYLNHANYFFEILKLDSDEPAVYGEPGRIVVTDLFNYVFPLIRYDTGDVGVMQPPDEYSNGYPVLQKLYGRKMDITYTTVGEPIHPLAYTVLEKWFNCVQWQIIQKGEKDYIVKISTKSVNDTNEDNLIDEFKKIVGDDASVIIERVDEIPVLDSGKRKLVICEL